jgi:site-specific recombinase XerD
MSRIYKRDNSPYWWYTSGTDPSRVKKSMKTKDRKVAVRIQQKWDSEIALSGAGLDVPTVSIHVPFKLYTDIIEHNKKKKQSACIRSTLNMFISKHPDITNKHITSLLLQTYFTQRKMDGKSPKTINEDHKIIHNWCIWMISMGYISTDPTANLIRPALIKTRPRQAYTRSEVKRALDEAWLDHDKIFWNVLYKTGLRAVDACTLTPDHINGATIELNQSKTERYNNSGQVVIPLHKDLQNMDIFNIMKPGSIGNSRERLKKIIGHGDLHTFRHSFASHLEEFGASRWDTKCLLGHKANDVTAQYVKVNVHKLRSLIDQL